MADEVYAADGQCVRCRTAAPLGERVWCDGCRRAVTTLPREAHEGFVAASPSLARAPHAAAGVFMRCPSCQLIQATPGLADCPCCGAVVRGAAGKVPYDALVFGEDELILIYIAFPLTLMVCVAAFAWVPRWGTLARGFGEPEPGIVRRSRRLRQDECCTGGQTMGHVFTVAMLAGIDLLSLFPLAIVTMLSPLRLPRVYRAAKYSDGLRGEHFIGFASFECVFAVVDVLMSPLALLAGPWGVRACVREHGARSYYAPMLTVAAANVLDVLLLLFCVSTGSHTAPDPQPEPVMVDMTWGDWLRLDWDRQLAKRSRRARLAELGERVLDVLGTILWAFAPWRWPLMFGAIAPPPPPPAATKADLALLDGRITRCLQLRAPARLLLLCRDAPSSAAATIGSHCSFRPDVGTPGSPEQPAWRLSTSHAMNGQWVPPTVARSELESAPAPAPGPAVEPADLTPRARRRAIAHEVMTDVAFVFAVPALLLTVYRARRLFPVDRRRVVGELLEMFHDLVFLSRCLCVALLVTRAAELRALVNSELSSMAKLQMGVVRAAAADALAQSVDDWQLLLQGLLRLRAVLGGLGKMLEDTGALLVAAVPNWLAFSVGLVVCVAPLGLPLLIAMCDAGTNLNEFVTGAGRLAIPVVVLLLMAAMPALFLLDGVATVMGLVALLLFLVVAGNVDGAKEFPTRPRAHVVWPSTGNRIALWRLAQDLTSVAMLIYISSAVPLYDTERLMGVLGQLTQVSAVPSPEGGEETGGDYWFGEFWLFALFKVGVLLAAFVLFWVSDFDKDETWHQGTHVREARAVVLALGTPVCKSLMAVLACDPESRRLLSDPSIECWEWSSGHAPVAWLAALALIFFGPTAVLRGAREAPSDADLASTPFFESVAQLAHLFMLGCVLLSVESGTLACLGLGLGSAGMLFFLWRYESWYGCRPCRVQAVVIWRRGVYALGVWTALCGLFAVSLDDADDPLPLVAVLAGFVGVGVWLWLAIKSQRKAEREELKQPLDDAKRALAELEASLDPLALPANSWRGKFAARVERCQIAEELGVLLVQLVQRLRSRALQPPTWTFVGTPDPKLLEWWGAGVAKDCQTPAQVLSAIASVSSALSPDYSSLAACGGRPEALAVVDEEGLVRAVVKEYYGAVSVAERSAVTVVSVDNPAAVLVSQPVEMSGSVLVSQPVEGMHPGAAQVEGMNPGAMGHV